MFRQCDDMEGKKKEKNNSKDLPDENGDRYHFLRNSECIPHNLFQPCGFFFLFVLVKNTPQLLSVMRAT